MLKPNQLAPITNVSIFAELMDSVMSRADHLPGMATFHGFSGYGKTQAAVWGANKHRAFYIQLGDSWTKAKLCRAIMAELGLHPSGTIADMVDQIIDRLAADRRPLIIDEADFLIARNMVEIVREIHDKSDCPIILIGEELLPQKLQTFERFHNRILAWRAAQPANMDDADALARKFAVGFEIAPDLLAAIVKASEGRVRRIVVNIEQAARQAKIHGLETVTLADWGDLSFFDGQPPSRRA